MSQSLEMANQSVIELLFEAGMSRLYARRKEVKELKAFDWLFRDKTFEPYFKTVIDRQLETLLNHRYMVEPHGTYKLRAVLREISQE